MATPPTHTTDTLLARLRHRLQPPETPRTSDPLVSSPAPLVLPEVEFAGYAEDCRIFGFLRLDAERLSDALNAHAQVQLVDALVIALDDGHALPAEELWVAREELLAVRASGPRGNPGRRSRSRPYPVALQSGPYEIHGYLHGPPGADPIRQLARRPPMVPLTEAWVMYQAAGQDHRARVGTLIVNRELLDWVRPARNEEVAIPSLPMEPALDPRAKDLTGYIWTNGRPRGPGAP